VKGRRRRCPDRRKEGSGRSREGEGITEALARVETDLADIARRLQSDCHQRRHRAGGRQEYLVWRAGKLARRRKNQSTAVNGIAESGAGKGRAYTEMNDASNSLAQLAEKLKTSTSAQKSAEELAAAAEELSANAEEVKSASGQISGAIEEISRAAQLPPKPARSPWLWARNWKAPRKRWA